MSYFAFYASIPVTCATVPYSTVKQLIGDMPPNYMKRYFEDDVRIAIQSALYTKLYYTLIDKGVIRPDQYTHIITFREDYGFLNLVQLAKQFLDADYHTLLTQVISGHDSSDVLSIITL